MKADATPPGAPDVQEQASDLPIDKVRNLPRVLQFKGEFGEELNSFIPYVHWLFRTGALGHRKVRTYAGMEPFYFFLHPRQVLVRHKPRRYVSPTKAPEHYLHKLGLIASRSGCEWAPDYRAAYGDALHFDRPTLVIHNKYTTEWNGPPINYFERETLEHLFSRLKAAYQIVFFEAARSSDQARGYSEDHQAAVPYDDVEIARAHPEVIVFGDLLAARGESYNELKLKIFSSCYHFITVQGGNAHMCASFPGSLVAIQHVRGKEEKHAYAGGVFQFLSNPPPTYMICRDGAQMRQVAEAFDDCVHVRDRVLLGPRGAALYRRFNPWDWASGLPAEGALPTSGADATNLDGGIGRVGGVGGLSRPFTRVPLD